MHPPSPCQVLRKHQAAGKTALGPPRQHLPLPVFINTLKPNARAPLQCACLRRLCPPLLPLTSSSCKSPRAAQRAPGSVPARPTCDSFNAATLPPKLHVLARYAGNSPQQSTPGKSEQKSALLAFQARDVLSPPTASYSCIKACSCNWSCRASESQQAQTSATSRSQRPAIIMATSTKAQPCTHKAVCIKLVTGRCVGRPYLQPVLWA